MTTVFQLLSCDEGISWISHELLAHFPRPTSQPYIQIAVVVFFASMIISNSQRPSRSRSRFEVIWTFRNGSALRRCEGRNSWLINYRSVEITDVTNTGESPALLQSYLKNCDSLHWFTYFVLLASWIRINENVNERLCIVASKMAMRSDPWRRDRQASLVRLKNKLNSSKPARAVTKKNSCKCSTYNFQSRADESS